MELRRRDQETRKQFYRRLASIKKHNWANQHHLQEDEYFKSHFIGREEDNILQNCKSKKIAKNQPKTEHKLRNRAAAQESRQRHRSYVQELERKVKMYEQLLEAHGTICKSCKKTSAFEGNDIIAQPQSENDQSQNLKNERIQEKEVMSFPDDLLMRFDHQGGTTPFGIFFILCIVGVLAIFNFNLRQQDIAPHFLANYHSPIHQFINRPYDTSHQSYRSDQEHPKFLEFAIPHQKYQQLGWKNKDSIIEEYIFSLFLPSYTTTIYRSAKYASCFCTKPEIALFNQTKTYGKRDNFDNVKMYKNSAKGQKSDKGLKRLKKQNTKHWKISEINANAQLSPAI